MRPAAVRSCLSSERNDFDSGITRRLAEATSARATAEPSSRWRLAEVYAWHQDGRSRIVRGVCRSFATGWASTPGKASAMGSATWRTLEAHADHRRALAEVVEAGPVPASPVSGGGADGDSALAAQGDRGSCETRPTRSTRPDGRARVEERSARQDLGAARRQTRKTELSSRQVKKNGSHGGGPAKTTVSAVLPRRRDRAVAAR